MTATPLVAWGRHRGHRLVDVVAVRHPAGRVWLASCSCGERAPARWTGQQAVGAHARHLVAALGLQLDRRPVDQVDDVDDRRRVIPRVA